MKIFVPGRICLFGEHSDWAGGYRRINADIEKGYTLITGTNQGIHAEVKSHPSKLILHTTLSDGKRKGPFEVDMKPEALLREAEKGGFFSYVAGVAYQVLTHYRVRGLEIDNNLTDLPIKKGLSSSAAICVLVARAFNRLYDLKMTIRGEMEFAYMGEITTPSRCGRMDQGCAYGNRPILMIFDGERIDIRELNVPRDLYYVIVDLNASKDTKEILSKLNQSYPFADNTIQKNVQKYLGPINRDLVQEAADALEKGESDRIGGLMNKAQAEFDRYLSPACPSQLTAPVLHKLLGYQKIQSHILGGKGVGSQGDGSVQLLVKDGKSQDKVIQIIEKELGMSCLKLVIGTGRRVRKAVIPAAGFSARLFPASKAVKKELFPIIDREGRAKPIILTLVEEAINAGIEEVCIIVQPQDQKLFEEFFTVAPVIENFNKLAKEDKKYCQYILDLGHRITYIQQERQEGFGHAVYCAREWVGEEPFLLMLGDHVYQSTKDISCARQLLDVYSKIGTSVVGLKKTPVDNIHQFGCVTGVWEKPGTILTITEFSEKPEKSYAEKHLHIENMEANIYLTIFGQYILHPKIFDILEDRIQQNIRERGDFQLTSCLDILRTEEGFIGYVMQGKRFDIGTPEAYQQSMIDYDKG
jgi:UTP-glucose-1-phosphate uridylyltransferase/mevalonate kinase